MLGGLFTKLGSILSPATAVGEAQVHPVLDAVKTWVRELQAALGSLTPQQVKELEAGVHSLLDLLFAGRLPALAISLIYRVVDAELEKLLLPTPAPATK